jgi:hypothetical protein
LPGPLVSSPGHGSATSARPRGSSRAPLARSRARARREPRAARRVGSGCGAATRGDAGPVGGRVTPGAPEHRDARAVRIALGAGSCARPRPQQPRLYPGLRRTVSAFLHLSLVGRRPRLAVYVRPHGRFGRWYLRGIDPFPPCHRLSEPPGGRAAGRPAARRLSPTEARAKPRPGGLWERLPADSPEEPRAAPGLGRGSRTCQEYLHRRPRDTSTQAWEGRRQTIAKLIGSPT